MPAFGSDVTRRSKMSDISYFVQLDDLQWQLEAACRLTSDRLDELRPESRLQDTLAAQWLAIMVEKLAREAEDCGGPAGLAAAGTRLADAADAMDDAASIGEAQRCCDTVEGFLPQLAAMCSAGCLTRTAENTA